MSQFAIVIPNLNQSRFLPDAFESLRHQAVPFSLAVMDGGSTDHFESIVQKYEDIITYLQSEPDGGQARAISVGSNMVAGDVVSWLNADDYYFPGALNKVASVFKENPDVDVVYGDAVHVKPDGTFLSYFPAIEDFNPKRLPFSCFICQPACFVRRSVYDAVGGINPALRYTMDWDLWCRLASHGAKFKYLRDVLAAVRYYPETKTLSGDKQRYQEIWRIGRIYGKRFLPVSWLGFYRFDLSFKPDKSTVDKFVFNRLEWLRKIKKQLFKQTQDSLYGFYRWHSGVDGQCLIQFPLYGDKIIRSLCLEVSPSDGAYLVEIDSVYSETVYAIEGKLFINMPQTEGPGHCIGVECFGRRKWEMKNFSFKTG